VKPAKNAWRSQFAAKRQAGKEEILRVGRPREDQSVSSGASFRSSSSLSSDYIRTLAQIH
jgi:hypothetical protein